MTERLERIFSLVPYCDTFADIGCDHGYISKKALETGRAKKVYASDISAQSLNKAKDLIGDGYGERFLTFVADGFKGLPKDIDVALIAGMGGEEICAVIRAADKLPQTLILQPMKNSDKVRRLLIELGYGVDRDFTFFASNKYYDLIRADNRLIGALYTETDYLYGKENVKKRGEDFLRFVKAKHNELSAVANKINGEKERARVEDLIKELEGFLK